MTVGGIRSNLLNDKAGDVFFIPAGTIHAARNVGSSPARLNSQHTSSKRELSHYGEGHVQNGRENVPLIRYLGRPWVEAEPRPRMRLVLSSHRMSQQRPHDDRRSDRKGQQPVGEGRKVFPHRQLLSLVDVEGDQQEDAREPHPGEMYPESTFQPRRSAVRPTHADAKDNAPSTNRW